MITQEQFDQAFQESFTDTEEIKKKWDSLVPLLTNSVVMKDRISPLIASAMVEVSLGDVQGFIITVQSFFLAGMLAYATLQKREKEIEELYKINSQGPRQMSPEECAADAKAYEETMERGDAEWKKEQS